MEVPLDQILPPDHPKYANIMAARDYEVNNPNSNSNRKMAALVANKPLMKAIREMVEEGKKRSGSDSHSQA